MSVLENIAEWATDGRGEVFIKRVEQDQRAEMHEKRKERATEKVAAEKIEQGGTATSASRPRYFVGT